MPFVFDSRGCQGQAAWIWAWHQGHCGGISGWQCSEVTTHYQWRTQIETNRIESNRVLWNTQKSISIECQKCQVRRSGDQEVRPPDPVWGKVEKPRDFISCMWWTLWIRRGKKKLWKSHSKSMMPKMWILYTRNHNQKKGMKKKKNTYNLWLKHFNWTKIVVFLFIHVFIYLAGSFRNIFLKFIVQFRTFFRLPINSLLSFILITFLSLFIIAWRVLHASWARFSNIRIRLDMLSVYIYFYKYI